MKQNKNLLETENDKMSELLGNINGSDYFLSQHKGEYRLTIVTGTAEPKDIANGSKFDCVSAFIDCGLNK